MKESQNIEWKNAWRDEYFKWICGFANANGGKLEIGKSDLGDVVGLNDAQKLMEDLPNRIRDLLGIIVDVNLHSENGKDWISIEVSPHPYPVSYRGQYHYRSGSTKQELKGTALDRFLLQKQGKRWDSVPVPHVLENALSADAFAYFRKKATQTNRVDIAILQEDDHSLIEKLRLREKGYLKRAAILLFHADPEEFFTGAYVKIGYFRTEEDLRFQDEIHGHLFEQVEKTMDLLLTKYLEAQIRYEGISRIEEFSYPESAIREALLNAIAHKDYSSGIPIQIKVYESRIAIWNAGELPETWTVADLLKEHASIPFNPDIATVFFRAGLIESWGRGILKIIQESVDAGLPAPTFSYNPSGFRVEFNKAARVSSGKSSEKVRKKFGKSSEKILDMIRQNNNITIAELAEHIGISTRAVEKHLANLKEEKRINRVGSLKGGHWEVIEE
ncbi:MAG: putative DNA binding domain-containing protein [Saprospirales bacterium]|nr:putative DNA binding domain-containing protein [Saprospirales bacterium]